LCNLNKHNTEIFSEFAFRPSVQFHHRLESEGTYDNIEHLQELLQLKQFNTCLDSDLGGQL